MSSTSPRPSWSTGSRGPSADGGRGGRRPPAVDRSRPAVAHRLRGDAARAAHDARARRGTARPRWWCRGSRRPGVVERPERLRAACRGTRPTTRSTIVADLAGGAGVAAIGDHTWARFLVDLLASMPSTTFRRGASVMSARCGAARTTPRSTRCAAAGGGRRPGGRPAAGRARSRWSGGPRPRCRSTSAQRLIAEGHQRVNFAIVAAGENAASPHHEPGERVIRAGEVVLCDFGGTLCDRLLLRHHPLRLTSVTRRPRWPTPTPCCTRPSRPRSGAATVGTPCEEVDAAARRIIAAAGYGPSSSCTAPATASGSRSTRTPTSWRATPWPLAPGHAFCDRAGHLRRRPLGHAAGGHRRRRRRGTRGPEPCRPRPGGRRRLTAVATSIGRASWAVLVSPGGRRRTGRRRPGAS